jgi:predicted permease
VSPERREVERAVRRYRRLLALLPAELRSEAGDELEAVFRDEFLEALTAGGRLRRARLWARILVDLAITLPGAWRRPARIGARFGSWLFDARVALRGLAKQPAYAAVVSLTLGLGIGATATIYSVVDGVVLRPLAYQDPGSLVLAGALAPTERLAGGGVGLQVLARLSVPNFRDYRDRARLVGHLAAIEPHQVPLRDAGDGPELLAAASATPELFAILGAAPVVGRTLQGEDFETAAPAVGLLSHGAWLRRFGGDPDVVGRPFPRAHAPVTIVGVMDRGFSPPEALFAPGEEPDLWMPLREGARRYERRAVGRVHLVGRLVPGASIEAARAEAGEIAMALAAEYPGDNRSPSGTSLGIGVNALHAQTVGESGGPLGVFLAAAGLLLLLTCLNAAMLVLARSIDRARELGVRAALGAARARLVRLVLVEALLLSLMGGALGVVLAHLGVGAFLRYAPPTIPRLGGVGLDLRVLLFAVTVTLGAGVVAGLLPALRVTRRQPWERLRSDGRSTDQSASRLRSALIAGQIALAVTLLSGAGLLIGSFARITAADPGFDADGLIAMEVDLEGFARTSPDRFTSAWAAWNTALEELRAVPGVESAEGATGLPFESPSWAPRVLLDGDESAAGREGIAGYVVTNGYFRTMRTPILEGRAFEATDGPDGAPVAIVNQSFVRRHFGGRSPIGERLRLPEAGETTVARIVGVAADVVQRRVEDGPSPAIYLPYTQRSGQLKALVRTELAPATIVPELRRAVARFNPLIPAQDVGRMRDRAAATWVGPRFQSLLLASFGLVATGLALSGLYASLAHAVRRRRRELGVRIALGADRSSVLRLIVAQGLRSVVAGLGAGILLSLALTRLLAGLLYQVRPNDPVTLLAVGVGFLSAAVLASVVPAWGATTVDPVTALDTE